MMEKLDTLQREEIWAVEVLDRPTGIVLIISKNKNSVGSIECENQEDAEKWQNLIRLLNPVMIPIQKT